MSLNENIIAPDWDLSTKPRMGWDGGGKGWVARLWPEGTDTLWGREPLNHSITRCYVKLLVMEGRCEMSTWDSGASQGCRGSRWPLLLPFQASWVLQQRGRDRKGGGEGGRKEDRRWWLVVQIGLHLSAAGKLSSRWHGRKPAIQMWASCCEK